MQEKKFSQVRGMSVRTVAGVALGSVRDVVFDGDTGRLAYFLVRTRLIGGTDLCVTMDAVVEIADDAVIVKDGLVPDAVGAVA